VGFRINKIECCSALGSHPRRVLDSPDAILPESSVSLSVGSVFPRAHFPKTPPTAGFSSRASLLCVILVPCAVCSLPTYNMRTYNDCKHDQTRRTLKTSSHPFQLLLPHTHSIFGYPPPRSSAPPSCRHRCRKTGFGTTGTAARAHGGAATIGSTVRPAPPASSTRYHPPAPWVGSSAGRREGRPVPWRPPPRGAHTLGLGVERRRSERRGHRPLAAPQDVAWP
jgi:hypothetical protein